MWGGDSQGVALGFLISGRWPASRRSHPTHRINHSGRWSGSRLPHHARRINRSGRWSGSRLPHNHPPHKPFRLLVWIPSPAPYPPHKPFRPGAGAPCRRGRPEGRAAGAPKGHDETAQGHALVIAPRDAFRAKGLGIVIEQEVAETTEDERMRSAVADSTSPLVSFFLSGTR
jgi:hypothetical protein